MTEKIKKSFAVLVALLLAFGIAANANALEYGCRDKDQISARTLRIWSRW